MFAKSSLAPWALWPCGTSAKRSTTFGSSAPDANWSRPQADRHVHGLRDANSAGTVGTEGRGGKMSWLHDPRTGGPEGRADIVITPITHDIGGLRVHRALPHSKRSMVGAFVLSLYTSDAADDLL